MTDKINQTSETVTLVEMPKLIKLSKPYDKNFVFFVIPSKDICECLASAEEVPIIDLRIEQFVKLSSLPQELQEEIRKYLVK
jgi:hypothetical protein